VPIGTLIEQDYNDQSNLQKQSKSMKQQNEKKVQRFRDMDDEYRKAIIGELELIGQAACKQNSQEPLRKIPVRSIYFGGGTPSLAPLSTLRAIIDAIQLIFHVPSIKANDNKDSRAKAKEVNIGVEMTIEMDPGTFSLSKLQKIHDMGFNRISLGVQSFDDRILESLGRVHRRRDIIESVEMIDTVFGRNCDENRYPNYSIDLISGLPGMDMAKWIETLQLATSPNFLKVLPNHLSVYDLQVEEGTVFGTWYAEEGENENSEHNNFQSPIKTSAAIPLPSQEDCAFMYKFASGYLRSKGFDHYEISSYARIENNLGHPRYPELDNDATNCNRNKKLQLSSWRSQHNQIYWDIGSSWYAIGLGATSSVRGKIFARPRQMNEYLTWVSHTKKCFEENARHEWVPPWLSSNKNSADNDSDILDIIMTRLRTREGLDLEWVIKQDDGPKTKKAILRGSRLGFDMGLLKRFQDEDGRDTLRLVDPQGFLFSNSIISSIFSEL